MVQFSPYSLETVITMRFINYCHWDFSGSVKYYCSIYTIHPSCSCIDPHVQGIGDSGQGIVNAFLFCLLTPRVRQKLLTCFVHVLCCAWFCHAYCREKSRRRSCCCSLWCCCHSKDGDRYSMVHSIASVDLHHSNSVSYPFLHAKVKRYSACTISTTSGSSVTDYDQELSPDMH